jgi:hypothetical protein
MLTKKLIFDSDVLSVLRAMQWTDGGLLGIITSGQLERNLYERVNKALLSLGGKWNRNVGGHIFKTDPRPSVEGLLESGELTVVRDGFFETPPTVVDRMLTLVPPNGFILEPSAGLGAIVDQLPVDKDMMVCIEKNQQRVDVLIGKGYTVSCCDFLLFLPDLGFDTVYMNPPFEELQDLAHVRHAYDCLVPGGRLVSVMSAGPFFRQDRKSVDFRAWLESVGGYSEQLPAGSFEPATSVNAYLVVVDKAE